jgi:hypothetical protein
MPPTGLDTLTDAARAERVEQLRTLADDALAKEFHALHEQARALQHRDDLSRAERRAQIATFVRAEGAVLAYAQEDWHNLQRLLSEQHRQP